MEQCPDREILEKFVDQELSEEMNENIFGHLADCTDCREKVRCLFDEDKGLINALLASNPHKERVEQVSATACLPRFIIQAYANDALSEDRLKLVDSHLENCNDCILELMKMQRLMKSPIELDLDMSAMKTKAVDVHGPNILEIVLSAKDDLLELIRHTGELISLTPQMGTVRGKEVEEQERAIVIRKDFSKEDLSIELRINRVPDDGTENISISLMRLSSEDFIPEMNIEISGEKVHDHANTDENGIAEFYGIKSGSYAININGKFYVSLNYK